MRPIIATVGPLVAASANNIALTQTPAGAGNLTLNGSTVTNGVATLDVARTVLITPAADETGHNFTVTGTDWAGSPISEVLAGTNTVAMPTVLSYKTVTKVSIDHAATGAVTVGTTTTASSQWVRFDGWANPSVSKQAVVSGTINYTVQYTMDDPNAFSGAVNPNAITWANDMNTEFVGATASQFDLWAFVPIFARVFLNSGTGAVTTTFQQTGSAPY